MSLSLTSFYHAVMLFTVVAFSSTFGQANVEYIMSIYSSFQSLLWMLVLLSVSSVDALVFSKIIRRSLPCIKSIHDASIVFSSKSGLTSWVIENLEEDEEDGSSLLPETTTSSSNMKTVTKYSQQKAGENDSLPAQGLSIGPFRIFASIHNPLDTTTASIQTDITTATATTFIPIRLFQSRNGWGTGVHPTTRLCLEFLAYPNIIQPEHVFLDYGCGSGILSIAALLLGCSYAHGVDIEAEALISSERNVLFNQVMYFDSSTRLNNHPQNHEMEDDIVTHQKRRFKGWHTREIIPYSLKNDDHVHGADICVANILIGQLVRPSMVSTIVSNLSSGAWLCLSGIRPDEVNSLKAAYNNYVDWDDDFYAELAAKDTECSIQSYGFDVGTWSRVVGRIKMNVQSMDSRNFSEEAVS